MIDPDRHLPDPGIDDSPTDAELASAAECEANARLIAAAPDLLATLEKCIAVLEAMDRCYATRLGVQESAVLDEACLVVAKAKGE